MGLLKTILFLLTLWVLVRLVRRALLPATARRGSRARPADDPDLADLTQQDISDADYEEIPEDVDKG